MWLHSLILIASALEIPQTTVRFCVSDERTGEGLRSTISLRPLRDTDERGHIVVHRPWSSLSTGADGCIDADVGEELYQSTILGPQHYSREIRFDPRDSNRVDVEVEPFEASPQAILIVDEVTGEPVDSARVLMEYGGERSGPGSPEARTDVHGRVVFPSLADGPYWLQVAGQPRIEFRSVEVDLTSERSEIEVQVRINPRVLVVGRVVDETGAPIEGARIRAARYRSKTRTQADGGFEVYAFATSTAFVTASKADFETTNAPLRSEGVDWDVVDVGELVLRKRPTPPKPAA
ncbi:MAG: carboxypeptidase-like regulatory domain-containing protein, partial [Acidobacteriota bacterium]